MSAPAEGPATVTRHEFTEDVNDYSMCVCGIPADVHPEGSATEPWRDAV